MQLTTVDAMGLLVHFPKVIVLCCRVKCYPLWPDCDKTILSIALSNNLIVIQFLFIPVTTFHHLQLSANSVVAVSMARISGACCTLCDLETLIKLSTNIKKKETIKTLHKISAKFLSNTIFFFK